jgi:hypothetical protein
VDILEEQLLGRALRVRGAGVVSLIALLTELSTATHRKTGRQVEEIRVPLGVWKAVVAELAAKLDVPVEDIDEERGVVLGNGVWVRRLFEGELVLFLEEVADADVTALNLGGGP